jgi:hypothetical protein
VGSFSYVSFRLYFSGEVMLSKEELLDLGAKKAIHHQNEGCITSPVIENARTRWAAIDYEKGWKDCAFTFWPEIERLSKRLKGLGHNHVTRDIKEPGECPRCDNYHNARKVADLERKLKEIEGK